MAKIIKSNGVNESEIKLTQLCESTFFKLWTYSNVFKEKGVELCDAIAIFENNVFLFSDKAIKFAENKSLDVAWSRWKRKAVDKSYKQLKMAENWIKRNPSEIYLNAKAEQKIPIKIKDINTARFFKIVVANGAEEACKSSSSENIHGSLPIRYFSSEYKNLEFKLPFYVDISKNEIYHVLDSFNLSIVLNELDTITDLYLYLSEKETFIQKLDILSYTGEEELLTKYITNIDTNSNTHIFFSEDIIQKYNSISIDQGEWAKFKESREYNIKKNADKNSYMWDRLIDLTSNYMLNGQCLLDPGFNDQKVDPNHIDDQYAIFIMAKESRFSRRLLSDAMVERINSFPHDYKPLQTLSRTMKSPCQDKVYYVFLQIDRDVSKEKNDYRQVRCELLRSYCKAAKTKFLDAEVIVGIAIDAPAHFKENSEDFITFLCKYCTEEDIQEYKELSKKLNIMQNLEIIRKDSKESPEVIKYDKKAKIGVNDLCPCGSGRKYKRCCKNK